MPEIGILPLGLAHALSSMVWATAAMFWPIVHWPFLSNPTLPTQGTPNLQIHNTPERPKEAETRQLPAARPLFGIPSFATSKMGD